MNEIEERLWNYIDGNCSPEEQQAISRLIEEDAAYRQKYEELQLFNMELQQIEEDEPPMAFTYNVMAAIRTEQAQQPLKAAVDKRIIYIIGGFFILAITWLVANTLMTMNWNSQQSASVFNTAQALTSKVHITTPALKAFLFFDVLAALALLDGYLRKRQFSKQA